MDWHAIKMYPSIHISLCQEQHCSINSHQSNFFLSSLSHIYIYIYIYCHPQTVCFVVSQLISVTRYTRCFKLGSKLDWLHASWIFYCIATSKLSVSEGIFMYIYHFYFVYIYMLNGNQMLNSLEELCKWQPAIPSQECSTPQGVRRMYKCYFITSAYLWDITLKHIYIYIYIYMNFTNQTKKNSFQFYKSIINLFQSTGVIGTSSVIITLVDWNKFIMDLQNWKKFFLYNF